MTKLEVVLRAPDDHDQQVEEACQQVPDYQPVNSQDGTDGSMDDIKNSHDDTEEGEEEAHQEEDYHCDEDALSHHRLDWVGLVAVSVRATSSEGEGRGVFTRRAKMIVSSRSGDISILDHKVNI